jgi:hypothetical protein
MEWGKVQFTPEIEDEREAKDVNLGVEGLNSNGHGKEMDKEGHMMKIIEGLQREAKERRADSQNLMKVRDQQGELNLRFLKSLEIIEKKLERGRDSGTTESRRNHERRSRSRSGSRHRSHSRKHSNRETHSSSSPFPTRKHQKSGREELKGEMNKIKPPTFDGEHKKEEYAETWLLGKKKYFQLQNYSSRGRRETSLPFSETVIRNSHRLESREGLRRVHKDRDRHPFSVGVVKETTSIEIVPIKMVRQELYILFSKLKQWRIWAAECRGSTQP